MESFHVRKSRFFEQQKFLKQNFITYFKKRRVKLTIIFVFNRSFVVQMTLDSRQDFLIGLFVCLTILCPPVCPTHKYAMHFRPVVLKVWVVTQKWVSKNGSRQSDSNLLKRPIFFSFFCDEINSDSISRLTRQMMKHG